LSAKIYVQSNIYSTVLKE